MADMTVLLDHRILAGKAVHDAIVLHVRSGLQDDAAEIAAQRGARPDIAAGADDHVADQGRGRVNEGIRIDDRDHRLEAIARHQARLMYSYTRRR